jgi:hypothetical protein
MGLAVLAGLLTAGAASAQRYRGEPKDVNVFLKGGVGTYTGDLANLSDAGPSWGLTVNLQPLNILGVEVGYEGARNRVNDLGSNETAVLRNGVSALVKVAPPFIESIKPFVGAGLGASYVGVTGANSAGLYRNDFMEEVPLAAGLEFNSRSLTAGVRATYRFLIDEGWAGGANQGSLFDTTVTVGGRF